MSVKDDYNLDFLGLSDEHTERELEDALVRNITRFLQEMGGNSLSSVSPNTSLPLMR